MDLPQDKQSDLPKSMCPHLLGRHRVPIDALEVLIDHISAGLHPN